MARSTREKSKRSTRRNERPLPSARATPARERLLVSGAQLMADKGFNGVSVREICRHAGTSMNMIHHYFGSKGGLLDAVVEQYSIRVFDVPMRLLDLPAKSKDDFASRIEMLFEATLDALLDLRHVMIVVIREQRDPPALNKYMACFSEFLEHAKSEGFVRPELDTEMVTGALLDRLINQVQFAPWLKRSLNIDLAADHKYKKRWCQSNLDLFLHGMVP
jgi:AcrR family transcriptional regulator